VPAPVPASLVIVPVFVSVPEEIVRTALLPSFSIWVSVIVPALVKPVAAVTASRVASSMAPTKRSRRASWNSMRAAL
jgi:hypothetical protein